MTGLPSRQAFIRAGTLLGSLYLVGGVAFLFVDDAGPAALGFFVAALFFFAGALRVWRQPKDRV